MQTLNFGLVQWYLVFGTSILPWKSWFGVTFLINEKQKPRPLMGESGTKWMKKDGWTIVDRAKQGPKPH